MDRTKRIQLLYHQISNEFQGANESVISYYNRLWDIGSQIIKLDNLATRAHSTEDYQLQLLEYITHCFKLGLRPEIGGKILRTIREVDIVDEAVSIENRLKSQLKRKTNYLHDNKRYLEKEHETEILTFTALEVSPIKNNKNQTLQAEEKLTNKFTMKEEKNVYLTSNENHITRSKNKSTIQVCKPTKIPPVLCNYCDLKGHTSSECQTRLQQAQGQEACQICNRTNHIASECYYLIRCQICDRTGHNTRDCRNIPRPVICQFCNQPGHTAKNCRENGYDSQHNGQRSTVTCQKCGRIGHTYTQCKLNAYKETDFSSKYSEQPDLQNFDNVPRIYTFKKDTKDKTHKKQIELQQTYIFKSIKELSEQTNLNKTERITELVFENMEELREMDVDIIEDYKDREKDVENHLKLQQNKLIESEETAEQVLGDMEFDATNRKINVGNDFRYEEPQLQASDERIDVNNSESIECEEQQPASDERIDFDEEMVIDKESNSKKTNGKIDIDCDMECDSTKDIMNSQIDIEDDSKYEEMKLKQSVVDTDFIHIHNFKSEVTQQEISEIIKLEENHEDISDDNNVSDFYDSLSLPVHTDNKQDSGYEESCDSSQDTPNYLNGHKEQYDDNKCNFKSPADDYLTKMEISPRNVNKIDFVNMKLKNQENSRYGNKHKLKGIRKTIVKGQLVTYRKSKQRNTHRIRAKSLPIVKQYKNRKKKLVSIPMQQ